MLPASQIVDADDVGVAELGKRHDLAAKAFAVGLGQVRPQHLKRHLALEVAVERAVNLRHATMPQLAGNLETLIYQLTYRKTRHPSRISRLVASLGGLG